MISSEPGEDIELEVGDVVVAGEVDRRLERHRFQTRRYRVNLKRKFCVRIARSKICFRSHEHLPWNNFGWQC